MSRAGKWIDWHGGPRPLSAGTVVDLHYDTGEIQLGAVIGDAMFVDTDGNEYGDLETNKLFDGASWTWAHRFHPDGAMIAWIIAYRLHEPEEAAEEARRAVRIDQFRKIADAAPLDSSRPAPEPVPAPFCRREVLNPPTDGLIHVSVCVAGLWLAAARDLRDQFSQWLAEDLTPQERAEAHMHIRNLTALIQRHEGGDQ